jgi:hypothetical protein
MRTFGHWIEIGTADKLCRRLVVKCRCGRVATVSLEALQSGASTSCGCAPLSEQQQQRLRDARAEQQRQRDSQKLEADRPMKPTGQGFLL